MLNSELVEDDEQSEVDDDKAIEQMQEESWYGEFDKPIDWNTDCEGEQETD